MASAEITSNRTGRGAIKEIDNQDGRAQYRQEPDILERAIMTANPDGVRLLAKVDQIDAVLNRDEHDSGYQAFVHIRKIWPQVAALVRAASVPQRGAEPVAWRWRHVNAERRCWNYQSEPIRNHNEYLQVESLYATPARCDAGSARKALDDRFEAFTIDAWAGLPQWIRSWADDAHKYIRALAITPALPAGEEVRRATALARRLCQLFDSGGESQRSVRARHASAIFQLLSGLTSNSDEWQKCDADPVAYLEACERRALSPSSNGGNR